MLLLAYACYILWWFFLKMKDPTAELPKIREEMRRLMQFAKVVGIAFVVAVLLSTGCDSITAGFEHGDDPGFLAACRVWQDLLTAVLWVVVIV